MTTHATQQGVDGTPTNVPSKKSRGTVITIVIVFAAIVAIVVSAIVVLTSGVHHAKAGTTTPPAQVGAQPPANPAPVIAPTQAQVGQATPIPSAAAVNSCPVTMYPDLDKLPSLNNDQLGLVLLRLVAIRESAFQTANVDCIVASEVEGTSGADGSKVASMVPDPQSRSFLHMATVTSSELPEGGYALGFNVGFANGTDYTWHATLTHNSGHWLFQNLH